MATFITNYLMCLIIGSSLLGAFAFKAWGRSRGKTSVYASDTSLNDVALSLAGSLFDHSPDKVIGGAQTYRSTWGPSFWSPLSCCSLYSALTSPPSWKAAAKPTTA